MTFVAQRLTGSADRPAWLRRTYLLAKSISRRRWPFPDDSQDVREAQYVFIALAATCLLDRLSAGGRGEYNNNPAYLRREFGSSEEQYQQTNVGVVTGLNGEYFASFETPDAGMWAFFQAVQRNERAYSYLAAGMVSFARWYAPTIMDSPVSGRGSFNSWLSRCDGAARALLQPLPSREEALEWQAWRGLLEEGAERGSSSADDPDEDSVEDSGDGSSAVPGAARPGYAYSATLGREVPNGECVQSRRDRRWYRAVAGRWVLTQETDAACTVRHPLSGSGGGSSGGSGGSASSSSSSAGLLIVALGAGAVWFFAKR